MDAVNIQTKFGLGEIVTTHQRRKGNQIIHDQIGEAITIQVSLMAAKTKRRHGREPATPGR